MKVRLKRELANRCFASSMFQFHEGPIKTYVAKATILVRTEFQFHEGPIKTELGKCDVSFGLLFQFHEGPIKT